MRRSSPILPNTDQPDLPVLDALPFFEAAARLGSFTEAGHELGVTAAAIAYRVKSLERHLGVELFSRQARSVRLNDRGRAYLEEVQRILAALHRAKERLHSSGPPRLRLVATEVVAEKWLMPRLHDFTAGHPGLAVELDTDRGAFDPDRRPFDVWVAFTDRAKVAPQCETLFEETLVPVCSPALLEVRGRPEEPRDLSRWPLLYDLLWAPYWVLWFAHHGAGPVDLSRASGFRLYSMMVKAAVDGMGVALGHTRMIAEELERGTLEPLFDTAVPAPARYVLCVSPDAVEKPGVSAFRDWIRAQAARPSPSPPSSGRPVTSGA
ncbi:MAG: LysR substrate-binding domain-containing protein [Rhodospirillales bacterium]|nr:LysR substrate-binding domain-containing protein [Rhodospirillales bacterium]MDE0378894.1 LysR substrate-binding domain-containing protein [Rhodospirillales bacterium]